MLFLLFSKEKGERWRRQFSVVCGFDLRLWLWSVDIVKYFLGRPSPKLPVRTNVIFKNENTEQRSGAETLMWSPVEAPRPLMSEWCHPPAPWSRPGWPASSGTFGCIHSAPPNWPHPGSWRGPVGMIKMRRIREVGFRFLRSKTKMSANL